MPLTRLSIAPHRSAEEQSPPLHNRWHPDIPAVAEVEPGEVVHVECVDWTGGQILNNDTADDVRELDLARTHYLSGPIAVRGAEPGDLLCVEILGLGVRTGAAWGFSAIMGANEGLFFDRFSEERKAIWNIDGVYATSRHIEGVRIAGNLHIGIIGCAPSHELLDCWNRRESAPVGRESGPKPIPAFATRPSPKGALLGRLAGSAQERAAREGAQVFGVREAGGYCGLEGISVGSRLYLPVFVPGAHLSLGGLEFSKGDGKVLFSGAIAVSGWADLRVGLIKGGAEERGIRQPVTEPGPLRFAQGNRLNFAGFSMDSEGEQYYLDLYAALRSACAQAIEHLTSFGYSAEQAYLLLAALPCEVHIDTVFAFPSASCSISIPTEAFTFDIRPSARDSSPRPRGRLAAPEG